MSEVKDREEFVFITSTFIPSKTYDKSPEKIVYTAITKSGRVFCTDSTSMIWIETPRIL